MNSTTTKIEGLKMNSVFDKGFEKACNEFLVTQAPEDAIELLHKVIKERKERFSPEKYIKADHLLESISEGLK